MRKTRARAFEESCRPARRAIDDLIENYEVSWYVILAQTSNGARADHLSYAELVQCPEVRARRNFVREMLVVAAMARDECNSDRIRCACADFAHGYRTARWTPRRVDV